MVAEMNERLPLNSKKPMVIWSGTEPLKQQGRFRIVDRGPARPERPDDVPFGLEQCLGCNFMKQKVWGPVKGHYDGSAGHAMNALTHALGLLLSVDPKKLDLNHPLYCEQNLSVAEGRESRGCDCDRPADPTG
jgi:hypothetical protein